MASKEQVTGSKEHAKQPVQKQNSKVGGEFNAPEAPSVLVQQAKSGPRLLSPRAMLRLQRTVGNQAARSLVEPVEAEEASDPEWTTLAGQVGEVVRPAPPSGRVYTAVQRYAEENDRTVFQGVTDCPLTLQQLFQIYTLSGDTIEFTVTNLEGQSQTVRFTREWVFGPQGAAVLRGRIRYQIAQEIESQGQALLDSIQALTGDPQRVQELAEDYQIASTRSQTNPEQARTTGPHLVEEARGMGESWNIRTNLPSHPLHGAWDLSAPRNTGVYAPLAGRVAHSARAAGYGWRVKILHPEGPDGRGEPNPVFTNYCHLDEVLVSTGDQVQAGQAVGLMGNTRFDEHGITTIEGIGTHLHFSVQQVGRGDPNNPRLSSEGERPPSGGIDPNAWFTRVTGSATPYRTQTTEPTSSDQSREVHELEQAGVPRSELQVRSGSRGHYTYHRANLGHIRELPAAESGGEAAPEAVPETAPETAPETSPESAQEITPETAGGSVQPKRDPALHRLDRETIHAVQMEQGSGPPSGVAGFEFLGMPVQGGVSSAMQTRLRAVEARLQAEYDALPEADRPATLQEYGGLQTISGWEARGTGSRHERGDAVDVNYENQPYIATRTTTGTRPAYGGERGAGAAPENQALRQPAVEVYDRAVAFIETNPYESPTAEVGHRESTETAASAYQRFRRTSDALRDYLSLSFLTDYNRVRRTPVPDPENAAEEDLLRRIPTSERKEEATAVADIEAFMADPLWQVMHAGYAATAREIYIRMLRDYEIVRRPMEVGEPSPSPAVTRNPALGFLHMPEQFVTAMMEAGQLRWGACDFSARSNGDVHHFDIP